MEQEKQPFLCALPFMRFSQNPNIVLVDGDKNEALTECIKVRAMEDYTPTIECISCGDLCMGDLLKTFKDTPKDVTVDVGAEDTVRFKSAIAYADVVVAPCTAMQMDNWGAEYMDFLMGESQKTNKNLRAFSFLNKVSKFLDVDFGEDFSDVLKPLAHLIFYSPRVMRDIAFRKSFGDGIAVSEIKGKKSKKSMDDIKCIYTKVFGENNTNQ